MRLKIQVARKQNCAVIEGLTWHTQKKGSLQVKAPDVFGLDHRKHYCVLKWRDGLESWGIWEITLNDFVKKCVMIPSVALNWAVNEGADGIDTPSLLEPESR